MEQVIEHIGTVLLSPSPESMDTQAILNKTVCLSLKLARCGVRKQVASNSVQSDADSDMLHVAKELLKSETYEAIKSLDSKIRSYIKAIRILSPMFKGGIYLIPTTLVEKLVERLKEFRAERQLLANKFVEEYPGLKEAAESQLNSLFNPLDYPEVNKIQDAIYMEWRIFTISNPGHLKQISEKIWQEEVDKARADAMNSFEEAKVAMRQCMQELVVHMMNSISVNPDGSKKRFHETNITKFVEFLNTFKDRNIMGDSELEKLASDSREILSGVSAVAIRTNEQLRDQLHSKFETIKSSLDTMLENEPCRMFNVKEED